MSNPDGQPPADGTGKALKPDRPAPGGLTSPPAPGGSPYPPAQGGSPYQPAQGGSPYPPAQGGSPYPPAQGGYPYPPAHGPYSPAQGASPYPPSPGAFHYPAARNINAYIEIPTVKPQANFKPMDDAVVLRDALKGMGTDKDVIINVLAHRTSMERQQILLQYQQGYGRDLMKDIKSELRGKFEDSTVALMTPLPIYLARELRWSMKGPGTCEKTLVEIICTRDNASLKAIKEAYTAEFKRELEDDIRGDTTRHFRSLLLSMCACSRDEVNIEDPALAKSLSLELYKAGEGKLGTDSGEFIRILSSYSYPLLRSVFAEYERSNDKPFIKAIKWEVSGRLKLGMEAVYYAIENSAEFFARALKDAMKGMTKNRALMRIVVSRCEIDMSNIKKEYETLFEKTLEQDIKSDVSGNFRRILLALVAE